MIRTALVACMMATPAAAFDSSDCLVLPAEEIRLGAPIPGQLSAVFVDRGEAVQKGQIIARLSSDVEEASLELARLRAANDSAVKTARTRLDYEATQRDRAKALSDRNVVSDQILEEREANYIIRQRELEEALVRLNEAQVEVRRAEALVAVRTIRSPIAGIVLERALDPGEYLRDDGHVVTLVQTNELRIEVFLPQDTRALLSVGDTARVEPELPRGAARDAVIEVIDPVIDPASGTYGVRLRLDNRDGALLAGVRCAASFSTAG